MVWMEKSPSDRATCGYCGEKIPKGAIRIGEQGRGLFPVYYHLECWVRRHEDFLSSLLAVMEEEGEAKTCYIQ